MRPHPPRCSALLFALGLMPLALPCRGESQSAERGFARARAEIAALETQAAERELHASGRTRPAADLLSLKFAFSLHESPSARAGADSARFVALPENASTSAGVRSDALAALPRFRTPRTFLPDMGVAIETMAQVAPAGTLIAPYSLPEIVEDTGFTLTSLSLESPSTGGPAGTVVPPSTVPEPSTLALLMTGGAVCAWQAWRRRRRG